MWAQLNREGIEVARCTVERLMRANGWRGVTRTNRVRTTVADPAAARPSDLVDRQSEAPRVASPTRPDSPHKPKLDSILPTSSALAS